jgi:non-heme chloroperoxidase
VPIGASARAATNLVKGSTLRVYAGAPRGLTATHKNQMNEDLQAFLKG